MFSVEYINIPKFIAIMVIAYLMNDVFLFMKFGNDATKQLMAIMLGYIIGILDLSEMNHLRTALGKRILCMRWDLCGKNLRNPNGRHISEEFFSGRRLHWFLQLCLTLHLYWYDVWCSVISKK